MNIPPKRILVVEDEPLIAIDLAEMLGKAGFEVVGPAGAVATALTLVRTEGCDAAVLDVNLGRETSAPIADELREKGTPFIVLSGYAPEHHPAVMQGAPRLAKPVVEAALMRELARLTAAV